MLHCKTLASSGFDTNSYIYAQNYDKMIVYRIASPDMDAPLESGMQEPSIMGVSGHTTSANGSNPFMDGSTHLPRRIILMFQIGDFIMYGDTGVCKITGIQKMNLASKQNPALYYTLTPVYQTCVIHTPVENPKVFMRPTISREMANCVIDEIPNAKVNTYHSKSVNDLTQHYQTSFVSHECEALVALTVSIFAKKQELEKVGRKPGAIDEKFMKRAEEMLFGEFAVALGISKDDVPAYIADRISKIKKDDTLVEDLDVAVM